MEVIKRCIGLNGRDSEIANCICPRLRDTSLTLVKGTFILGVLILSFVESSTSSVAFDYVPHPEFLEKSQDLNITSFIGHTARLPCTIRHLGTKRVSWIRGKDLQVLASGRTSFATDIRVSVLPGVSAPNKHKRSLHSSVKGADNEQESLYEDNTESTIKQHPERSRLPHSISVNQINDKRSPHAYERIEPVSSTVKRNKRSRKANSGHTTETALKGNSDSNAKVEKDAGIHARNLSSVEPSEDYQDSISIHPSGTDLMNGDPDSKRTIIPYNYLDEVWEPEDYTLQIKFAEKGDVGTYICQINTEPRMTQTIRLNVVDMVAEIIGRKELFVKEGSPVTLTCRISQEGVLSGFIFWYKQDKLVDYVNSNGRIEIKTTPEGRSELLLKKAVAEDSSKYTCEPSGGKAASATLIVIKDERPPLMKKGNGSEQITCHFQTWIFLLFISIFIKFL